MRLIQYSGLIHVQTTKRAEYEKCEKAAALLASSIGSAIGAEETDDNEQEFEASFAIAKGCLYTCDDVKTIWQEVKKEISHSKH